MRKESLVKIVEILFSIYLLALGWVNFIRLPILDTRIQITEIVFLPLLIGVAFLLFDKKIKIGRLNLLDKSVLVYLLAVFISILKNAAPFSMLEFLGIAYLATFYFFFKWFLQFRDELFKKIPDFIPYIVLFASLPAIVGSLMAFFGSGNYLVSWYPDYPYLGDIFRARGFMQSPNLLFNILACFFLLNLLWGFNKKQVWIWILAGITAVLTFAKSWLILMAALLLYFSFKVKFFNKWFLRSLSVLLLVLFSLGTYILVKSGDACYLDENIPTHRAANAFYSTDDFCLVESSYAILHKLEIKEGQNYLPFGVGPGNFIRYVDDWKQKGIYPSHLEAFEAHSTLFGTYIELGIPGLIALVFFIFAILSPLFKMNARYKMVFIPLFLFMCFEAIFNDANTFRHYWVILAILSYLSTNQDKT
jgi:hypothetical protein